ncbi:hypothetical protein [Nocardioides lijunqiniae]|uniref:hypothetical protein n=1 Tax=Nocardioides lijunqiniae TaxID=2760832 RepID=UPI00187869C8|nr:hypothetical protein [Nocardioides lijunqiniae]
MTFPRDKVVLRQAGTSSRVVDPGIELALERVWADQLAEAAARGLLLTDAPAYRLESAVEHEGVLELGLAMEPYRVHSAMKVLHRDPRVRPEHHDRTLVADGLVRTTDDHYLLLRTPKVTGVELQLVGGTASPTQRVLETADDLFGFMSQRVERALGVEAAEVRVLGLLGLVHLEVGCVNAVFDVRLTVRADEVRPGRGSEVVVVPAAGLRDFLAAGPAYLPSVAALL